MTYSPSSLLGSVVPAESDVRVRRTVAVRGIVQGVGFRPFVFTLATRLDLGGFVRNRADGVLIEIEGARSRLESFVAEIPRRCPPLARIDEVEVTDIPPRGESSFAIDASDASPEPTDGFFSPDVGTCEACLEELLDPRDRRYRYPFINCSHCGPRLTILRSLPYDRGRTTMAAFTMCDACRAEYEDPSSRRFHAQPIACQVCGPTLTARDASGFPVEADPLSFFKQLLFTSRVVAIKGLGGYHLTCDASSETAVRRLRERKHREEKPLAVMVADIPAAKRLCSVSAQEADLLGSGRRPIVLLRRLPAAPIAPSLAPGNPLLGVMLPYTPLHHLLARESERPLVMTSGNPSAQPIVIEDEDAAARLRHVADGFLMHDRRIHVRCDDSVARVISNVPVLIRRSRGYSPDPVRLPVRCRTPILALGGHLKNTFAFGRADRAIVSHHLGDLDDWTTYQAFREAVAHYEALFAFQPEVLAHDLHPGYSTTEYARQRQNEALSGVRLLPVQHHHAHMASCMAENGLTGDVIGIAFDGIGYGTDGSLWGGEFLVGGYRAVRRAAHLRPVRLPGAEQGIRQPWRMAAAYALDCDLEPEELIPGVRSGALRIVRRMIETGLNSPMTSSAGRLFDAVAALLGLRSHTSFEGQAAMELESLAERSDAKNGYPFDVSTDNESGALVVDTRPLLKTLIADLRKDEPLSIARRFHNSVVEIVVAVATRLRDVTGIEDAVLTGGVFQNALLLEAAKSELEARGFAVHTHGRVPANDGGLALGQLAVAAVQTEHA